MNLTVAIPTWNRAWLLRRTLDQLAQVRVPSGVRWEVVVVNNNSSDDTECVIASFVRRLPLRSVHEPRAGVAHARNRGAQEARGDYVLWADDDVLVCEDWIAAYCEAFERWPDAILFGGPIEPWSDSRMPVWLRRAWPAVANAYGERDLGPVPVPLADDMERVPFGANYAVAREVHARFRYDTNLGVRPGSIVGGEETRLMRQALAAGGMGWWVPKARVKHFVAEHELSTAYLRRYHAAYGRYLRRTGDEPDVPRVLGQPRWAYRQAVERGTRYLLRRLFGRPPEMWIHDLIESSRAWGYLREPPPRASR
jgi:glucosyl-dolichyl phosphate glucuronosyltransferase